MASENREKLGATQQMDERSKSAFDFAKETTCQVLALASGVLTLTITFFEKFVRAPTPCQKYVLIGSWVLLLLSACSGVFTLMAITGSLDPKANPDPVTVYDPSIRIPAGTQIISFGLGLILTVMFGISALWRFEGAADLHQSLPKNAGTISTAVPATSTNTPAGHQQRNAGERGGH